MSISGLAITLSDRTEEAEAAVCALNDHPAVEIGLRQGRRLAATTDATSAECDRELWFWMRELIGIETIDVVFVHFDEADHSERQR